MERIVSRDEWLVARKALLAKEKELTRMRDSVSVERRSLPRVKVDKEYVFDAPGGRQTLAELFGGRSQLIISCSIRSGRKGVRAARSWPIISTAHLRTSRHAT